METNSMTKKQLIESVIDSIKRLQKYDPEFYKLEPETYYKALNRRALTELDAELKRRLEMAAWVESLDGRIIPRSMAIEMQLKKVVKSGELCEYVGLGFVKIKAASERDVRTYYNIIS